MIDDSVETKLLESYDSEIFGVWDTPKNTDDSVKKPSTIIIKYPHRTSEDEKNDAY